MRAIDLNKIKAVFFDLDGTIYCGAEMADNADLVVNMFRRLGKKIFFVTNNSASLREQICLKLQNMGIACEESEIYSSGYATACYVKKEGWKKAYIMGTGALREEFKRAGIEHTKEAKVVVVGYDRDFDSGKLTDALQTALCARKIIICNREANYPVENKKRMPGCGAMAGALEGSLGREADVVIGKPNGYMLDMICEEHGFLPEELLLIGDTYETDIVMVSRYGSQGIYIGEEKYEDCLTVQRIGELLSIWNE